MQTLDSQSSRYDPMLFYVEGQTEMDHPTQRSWPVAQTGDR
jgi:hypothetical protein